jgi:REP element-mobilizing transposase RayT
MKDEPNDDPREPRGFYTRGYLARFDGGEHRTQFITCRLADSLPSHVLERIKSEIERGKPGNVSREAFVLAEKFLDAGHGECLLGQKVIADIVANAILELAKTRYFLYAWVVMPNHCHLLLRPRPGNSLERILHSLKSYTALEANRVLGRRGRFWMREAFDRYIRNTLHFERAVRYIENNPVKAGLCASPEDWEFSSAYSLSEREQLKRFV